jgi:hypothetical protein
MLIIPSGYKGGTAYAELPTNGDGDLTFTRASDAWRTNADGLIQRVPWNLLRYSEEFDNAVWGKASTTIVENAEIAPNGTMTADTMTVPDSTTNLFQAVSYGSGEYTFSVYVKVISTTTSGAMRLQGFVDGANVSMNFTPTTEWQLFTATYTATTSITSLRIRGQVFVGTLAIWGAQLVEGSSAQTYFPTTDRLNVPRLDYTYGSCPALLLEPQRTNLALQSETFDNASWVKVGSSVTANSTTSPSGVQDADTFSGDGILGGHELRQTISFINGTTYTFSVYAKKNTNNFLQLIAGSVAFGLNVWANFDLNNGIVGTVGSSTTASIQNVGNGWYRCVITGAASVTSSAFVVPFLISSATSIRGESSTLSTSVYLWGAQVEAGAYPTTYIPTTSATATRIADSFSRNNIYTNGLISASGGTWFVELRNNIAYTRDGGSTSLAISTTSADVFAGSTGVEILANTGLNRLSVIKRISGTATTLYLTTTDTVKIAVKWNGTNADVFVNGTKQVSATSFTTTNMEFLKAFGADVPKFIQAMALYPTPLSDTDCTTLTTL